jgi:type II secretory pathway pseudopilin PulG
VLKNTGTGRQIKRTGLTIIELVVILTILFLVIALAIPAIHQAREASRKAQCMNNLKKIGQAFIEHHGIHGHFPTGGWGEQWIGDPDRGYDEKQPGGWAFNVLPFLGNNALHDLGAGLEYDEKKTALTERVTSPLPIFHCPSRRAALNYPSWRFFNKPAPQQVTNMDFIAKTDYAANSGDLENFINLYPVTYEKGDGDFPWENTKEFSGICFQRSKVSRSDIPDGVTNTYLIGEKYMPILAYEKSTSLGDEQSLFAGQAYDTLRSAHPDYPPLHDQYQKDSPAGFGSAHSDSWQVAMCDGSVRKMSYKLSPYLHSNLGDRKDLHEIKKF